MDLTAKALVATIAVCSYASPLVAAEGFLMVEHTVAGSNTRTSQVQLERDRMRAEMTAASGETQIIVFDAPQQVLRIISPSRKAYTEITKADADRMGDQLGTAMAAMKEKMASMPPEQRAKMEALMSRLGGAATPAAAAAKPEYKRAGSDKVGKWACEKYEGFRNGQKVSEVCTVDPKVLGLTMADFDLSKQVAAFFQKMLPQGTEPMAGMATFEAQGFSGIPLRRIAYTGDKVTVSSEVTEVRRQTFPDSSYEVPAGFQKQSVGRGGAK